MAHKFSNFAEAYAHLETRWSIAQGFQVDAYEWCDKADDAADGRLWETGIKDCVWAIKATLSAFDNLLENYAFSFDQSVFTECYYWASQEGGDNGVDMSAILDAMWDAKPHQCLLFVPMIDAMRGSIWNKTVTVDWMSNALKHFT